MSEKSTIGERLSEVRAAKGETQEQVAESVGISYVALSRYETGQRMPKMDILARLADHYHVTIDELVNGEPKSDDQSDGSVSVMIELFRQLSPAGQQEILSHTAWLLSKHEQ